MQELDEGGGGAVRRRIAWEHPSEARPNDGERGCLGALRGAAAGSLVMVELLVAVPSARKSGKRILLSLEIERPKRPRARVARAPGLVGLMFEFLYICRF